MRCRHSHLNTLVRVHGVVTRRTGVFPQLAMLYYKCGSCGETLGPLLQSGDATHEVKPQARSPRPPPPGAAVLLGFDA